jgi:hypothetical protein
MISRRLYPTRIVVVAGDESSPNTNSCTAKALTTPLVITTLAEIAKLATSAIVAKNGDSLFLVSRPLHGVAADGIESVILKRQ